MTIFLVVLHLLVCVFLILFVLLQPGARGGVGAAFGGAGGQTVFGGRGANTFLAKLTAAAAVIFMLTSISLSYFISRGSSVMAGQPSVPAVVPSTDAQPKPTDETNESGANGTADPADPAAPSGAAPSGAAPSSAAPTDAVPAPSGAAPAPVGDPPPAPAPTTP